MKISEIEIKNFKSFEDVSVNLNSFNTIIGASASGKSNFIEAFQLLKDINEDFEKGITSHGRENIQNMNLKSTTPTYIKIRFENDGEYLTRNYDENTKIDYNSIEYELYINFKDSKKELIKEIVKIDFIIKKTCKNSLYLINQNNNITAKFEHENPIELEYFVPKTLLDIVNNNLKDNDGLIINSPLSAIPIEWKNYFKQISYYNFDPKFCNIDDGSENANLNQYGENLPIVLENILSNKERKRKYLNLISILLPYIKDIDVFRIENNRRIIKLYETYNENPILSPFISDGTIIIMALISAMYFESNNIVLIEEPERNIHPALFIQLVGMMEEVSKDKQIIITTQSPEILNYCNLDDIHLITRNQNAFSNLSKPADNKEIQEFIEDLGIGQLFVDNYLEFGNELT